MKPKFSKVAGGTLIMVNEADKHYVGVMKKSTKGPMPDVAIDLSEDEEVTIQVRAGMSVKLVTV